MSMSSREINSSFSFNSSSSNSNGGGLFGIIVSLLLL
jgi:hypothetical protein